MTDRLTLELPWPPSVNRIWRNLKGRTVISREYREWKSFACDTMMTQRLFEAPPEWLSGRLSVHIVAYPPDARKRDLDNILKSLLDALAHAKVYQDDSQVDRLCLERGEKGRGEVVVEIECRL